MVKSPESLTIDIFVHLEPVARESWSGDQGERPLNEVGQRQAERMATDLSTEPVDAVFSSSAPRCRQSVEPLGAKVGLPVQVIASLREAGGFRAPKGWEREDRPGADPLGGAVAAGTAAQALREIRTLLPSGRAVICSYGDIIPALLAYLAGAHNEPMPPRVDGRGSMYRIVLSEDGASLTSLSAPADFPS